MHAPLAPERRVLLKAADILREHGWCQGTIRDRQGRRCAVGAILMADLMVGAAFALPRSPYADLAMRKMLPDQGVSTWNDEPGRTVEEVIEAMERAALS